MSTEAFKQYYGDVVQKDAGLKSKLKAAPTADEFMKIAKPHAKKHGLDFSMDDVLLVLAGEELPDKELEQVAGGVINRAPIWQTQKTNPGGTCTLFSSAGNCCYDW